MSSMCDLSILDVNKFENYYFEIVIYYFSSLLNKLLGSGQLLISTSDTFPRKVNEVFQVVCLSGQQWLETCAFPLRSKYGAWVPDFENWSTDQQRTRHTWLSVYAEMQKSYNTQHQ